MYDINTHVFGETLSEDLLTVDVAMAKIESALDVIAQTFPSKKTAMLAFQAGLLELALSGLASEADSEENEDPELDGPLEAMLDEMMAARTSG